MTVPTGLSVDVEALHRLEAWEDILEHSSLDVMRSRGAIGGRWALVERPWRSVDRGVEARRERALIGPQFKDLPLESREVDVGWNGAV